VVVPGGKSLTNTIDEKNIGLKISAATAIMAVIGLVRCMWAAWWGMSFDSKWYSFDIDILFVMACYPVYLCFFTFLWTHVILRAFGFKNNGKKLITFLFFIQFMHLLITPIDIVGITRHIPYHFLPCLNPQTMSAGFSFNPFDGMPDLVYLPVYFTPLIMLFIKLTSLGINVVWALVFVAFLIFLRRELKVPLGKSLLILCLVFQTIYWPVYKYYFIFDGLFNVLTKASYHNHFGYGFYFLAGSVAGIAYLAYALKKPDF
jgi:hypothetical protein